MSARIALDDHLGEILGAAFEARGLASAYGAVAVSNRPDLGQFQCNGALAAAKRERRDPMAIAEAVVGALDRPEMFAGLTATRPGFINIVLADDFLAEWANRLTDDERLGCPVKPASERVVIDFGGPNVAKSMHVGHLRSAIIGDSLQRLFRFRGDEVVSDVHLGDWGTQMGMLIRAVERLDPDLPYFDADATGPFPADPPVDLDDLERIYPEATARCKADPAAMQAARQATAELQRGRPGYLALWRHIAAVSVAALKEDYAHLGVTFDLWKGESDVQALIPGMLDDLKRAGATRVSDGAVVIDLDGAGTEKGPMPPFLLVKSDGAVMYSTTDLATLKERVEALKAQRILYVVDQRQALHFRQLFRAAAITGIAGEARFEHIGFGTVNGPDGKPFKTRAGGVVKLKDLMRMAHDQALERLRQAETAESYDPAEKQEIARMVAWATVKYADLSNHRATDYAFDLDRVSRFEGRTGPYLLYSAVRIKSILAKAAEAGLAPGPVVAPGHPAERDLMLAIFELPRAVAVAYDKRAPNHLCEFAYQLAQTFSRFYETCHILAEPDGQVQASWLTLARHCLGALDLTLDLLGIEVPERM